MIAGSTDAGGDMPLKRCEKYSAIGLKTDRNLWVE